MQIEKNYSRFKLSKQFGEVNYYKQTIANMKKKMNDMERELKTLKEDSFNKLRSRFDNLRKKTPLSSKVPSYNELAERFERLKELKELKGRKKTKRKNRRNRKGKKEPNGGIPLNDENRLNAEKPLNVQKVKKGTNFLVILGF